ncbi:MAG: TrmH family RNA methyltransferase [Chloroflexota bacterium]
MTENGTFRTQECQDQDCRFRFPVMAGTVALDSCPKCGGPIQQMGKPYARHTVGSGDTPPNPVEMHVLVDNVRSIHNVGSIFRTAEAVGISQLYLCGMTPTPDNPRLAKTSIGAEGMIGWQYSSNGLATALNLKDQGMKLMAIEGGEQAKSLFEEQALTGDPTVVLVFGNELAGIDPGILAICDQILYIPMGGLKESLNVSVAFGIAAYYLRYSNSSIT